MTIHISTSLRSWLAASGLVMGLFAVFACGGSNSSTSSSSSAPSAAFTFSPAAPTVSLSVQFSDASTGTPVSWSWNFGDGSTSTSQNPTHVYTAAGTFSVTLTVQNAAGSNAKTQTVTVTGRTVGVMINDSRAFNGYTLFAPKQNTMTYLINNEGRIINTWTASKFPPGQSVYLLENGHLLRSCMTKGQLSSGGGEGGRVEEYDWDGNLVWELDFSKATYMQHHDIHILPNGNLLMLVVEKKSYAEVLAAGFNPGKLQPEIQQKGLMLPDYVVEIEPTRPVGGKVVWEWHVWDHLIQDYDATKSNYGVVAAHPELIDAAGDQKNLPAFWNHMNSIDYNAALDQIAMSVRGNSEVWIIDHGTTTAQAKGHSGGRRGKGGDLLYRWGNPLTYRAGTASDQRYFQQHDVEWVPSDCPGAGNLTCFNNGLGRGDYSTADEFTPAVTAAGDYPVVAGSAFGPKTFTWTYRGTSANPMYSENISGAHRLPDGHTIICSGTVG
ncbi:MAG: aryl-sulfate sulfotransferase, partial [Acidobacteria bacterium]|nr:aryl-sulfate sulfotransferase [Acidobacteriota bacterium]